VIVLSRYFASILDLLTHGAGYSARAVVDACPPSSQAAAAAAAASAALLAHSPPTPPKTASSEAACEVNDILMLPSEVMEETKWDTIEASTLPPEVAEETVAASCS
jgi:hypothetical protein